MKRNVLTVAAMVALTPAWAQQNPDPVVVTGNPLGSTELTTPVSALSGSGLLLRRGSSLGSTLDGLPGVAASYFGPNASRPVIRGQDGDRIRVLSNSGATLDASSLSFDHAVPIDPLVVERVEVLRGPAALLYGGSAIGGVVNAIDNRIPRGPIESLSGVVELRGGGADSERAASAVVETGGPGFALHADAFGRRTRDLRVPGFGRPAGDGTNVRTDRIVNSASSAQGGALGGSLLWDRGHLGASLDTYRNDYGIVAEEDVTIRMRRDKLALSGEVRPAGTFVAAWRAQASHTDYEHQEVEGSGEIGTTFATRGTDARLEAVHRPLAWLGGRLEGTWGAQFESSRFSALGEEAFVPSTRTRQAAAFVWERWSWGPGGHVSAGARIEQVRVSSDGDADSAEARFGSAQSRRFSPRSVAVGGLLNLGAAWQLTGNASSTQRAPTNYELFADGVHAATAAYERGDPNQRLERGRHLDLALEWRQGAHRLKVSAFDSRFSNYIALQATGEPDFIDEEGEALPIFAFRGVRARLHGLELEGVTRLLDGASQLDADVRLDRVNGTDLDAQEPLPRLPPRRVTVGLNWRHGAWSARAEIQQARAQTRVPATETTTPGWTRVNLSAAYALRWLEREGVLFLKMMNARDALAFNASTVGTLRSLVPLPGRSVSAGLRLSF
jgi:iron complex outermembrane receptor protein